MFYPLIWVCNTRHTIVLNLIHIFSRIFSFWEQYLLYGPFVAKVLLSRANQEDTMNNWCLHILIICALRGVIYQLWTSFVNMLFLTQNRRILHQGVDFNQIDKEWDWYKDFFLYYLFIYFAKRIYNMMSLVNLSHRRTVIRLDI